MKNLNIEKTFAQRTLYKRILTHENLHRSLYTQAFLHANALPPGKNTDSACTHRFFPHTKCVIYTSKFLHRNDTTRNMFLNINVFTNIFFTQQNVLYKKKRVYTNKFYLQKCSHKCVFTKGHFHTHTHTYVSTDKNHCTQNLVQREGFYIQKNKKKYTQKNTYILLHRNIWT